MSITEETSHVETSPSNDEAPLNISIMSVTEETSHVEMSPSNDEAPENIRDMSVTRDRSGMSVAAYTMLAAPWKADPMVVQDVSPHRSTDTSLSASGLSSSRMALRPP